MAIDIKQLVHLLIVNKNHNSRAIQYTSPKQIRIYKQIVFDEMSKQDITTKINLISQNLQENTLSSNGISTINTIDRYFTKVRLDDEKTIKKHIPNNAEWSLILHKAYYYHQLWLFLYNQQILGDDYQARIKK